MFLLVYVRDESTDQRFDKRVAERGIEQLLIIARLERWFNKTESLLKKNNREKISLSFIRSFSQLNYPADAYRKICSKKKNSISLKLVLSSHFSEHLNKYLFIH